MKYRRGGSAARGRVGSRSGDFPNGLARCEDDTRRNNSCAYKIAKRSWSIGKRCRGCQRDAPGQGRTEAERIRIVDGVSRRVAIQIEPARQPNRVRLRELTRSETKLRRCVVPGNRRPSRRCPTGVGADGRTRPQLNA